jgi:microcystin-dependent protein
MVAEAIAVIPAPTTVGYEIGDVRPWFTSSIPATWLKMEGQSTGALHATIISMYGANLPDMRDSVALGASGTKAVASTGGTAAVTLTTTELPGHTHTGPSHTHAGPAHVHDLPSTQYSGDVAHSHSGSGTPGVAETPSSGSAPASPVSDTGSSGTGATGSGGTAATGSAGSGSSFSVLNPYVACHWIVKVA